eukprot:6547946-Pyramimonas_sp.AAC.1
MPIPSTPLGRFRAGDGVLGFREVAREADPERPGAGGVHRSVHGGGRGGGVGRGGDRRAQAEEATPRGKRGEGGRRGR